MSNEIERKFLISKMPDLSNFESVRYERYYIYRDGNIEMRVQKKGEQYEIERKEMVNTLKAIKTKMVISIFSKCELQSAVHCCSRNRYNRIARGYLFGSASCSGRTC